MEGVKGKPDITKLEEFYLERSQQALFEAGKKITLAAVLFLTLLALSILIVFYSGSDDPIALPFVGIKLDRWLSAEVCIVLMSTCLLQFTAMTTYQEFLKFKVEKILQGIGDETNTWYLLYPDLWTFFDLLGYKAKKSTKWVHPVMGIFYIISHLAPFGLLLRIWFNVSFATHWLIAATLSFIFIFISMNIFYSETLEAEDRDTILKRLE